MADIPFFSGKDAVFRLFVSGPEIILNAKTWNVKMNGTKVADGVNGEQRDRLQFIPNYFELDANCHQGSTALLDALLSNLSNDDAGLPPLAKAGAVRLRILDGSRAAYIASELVIDDWDFQQGGRSERVMMALPIRFRFFKKTKSL